MEIMKKSPVHFEETSEIPMIEGIFRRNLAHFRDASLNLFRLEKDSKIPLHKHMNAQMGYVLKGKMRMFNGSSEYIVKTGSSYIFEQWEPHGVEILEDSEIIEVFLPCRHEFLEK